jgi:hypothetical protein
LPQAYAIRPLLIGATLAAWDAMNACTHCKSALPPLFMGEKCPNCGGALAPRTGRRPIALSPFGSSPSERPARISDRAPALVGSDDRWDLSDPAPSDDASRAPTADAVAEKNKAPPVAPSPPAVAPAVTPGATPSSAGVPGGPKRRPFASTMNLAPGDFRSAPTAVGNAPIDATLAMGRLDAEGAAQRLSAPSPTPEERPRRATPDLAVPVAPSPANASASAPSTGLPASVGVPPPSARGRAATLVQAPLRVAAPTAPSEPEKKPDPAPAPARRMAAQTLTLQHAPQLQVEPAPAVEPAPPENARAPESAAPRPRRAAAQTLVGGIGIAPPVAKEVPAPREPSSGTNAPAAVAPVAAPPVTVESEVARVSAVEPVEPSHAIVPPPTAADPARTFEPTPSRGLERTRDATPSTGLSRADSTGQRISQAPAGISQRQKPVLASDVLREDLCPSEPASGALRVVVGTFGAALLACAALGFRDVLSAATWAIPGVTALVVAMLPTSYATRALIAFAPSVAALVMQAVAVPGATTASGLVFSATACGLPAALLFRARFRASRRARWFVSLAIVIGVAWLLLPHGGALLGSGAVGQTWTAGHAPALVLAGVLLVSLLAFMGSNTTAGCDAWAALAIGWSAFAPLVASMPAGSWGASVRLESVLFGLSTGALSAIAAMSAASLAAVYLRPREPSTGIGAAAVVG